MEPFWIGRIIVAADSISPVADDIFNVDAGECSSVVADVVTDDPFGADAICLAFDWWEATVDCCIVVAASVDDDSRDWCIQQKNVFKLRIDVHIY